jgi:hypothetical protein
MRARHHSSKAINRRDGQKNSRADRKDGAVLKPAVKYQRIANTNGVPRDNH